MKFFIPWPRGRRSTCCIAQFMFFTIFLFHLGDFVSTLLPSVWHLTRECCIDFANKFFLILCNHKLPSIVLMLLLPQINHHLEFSISPQSLMNLRPYPKFKGTQASIYIQVQPQTQRLKRKTQIHNLKRP
jgi:hypothetical protein